MLRFAAIVSIAFLSCLALSGVLNTNDAGLSGTVMGMPAVCLGDHMSSEPCWLVAGSGNGVVVLGIGFGLVCFTIAGVGVFFATGQIAAGGIAIAQAGVALSFFFGQVGGAFVAFGQVVGGMIADGQGALGIDGEPFLDRLRENLREALGPDGD